MIPFAAVLLAGGRSRRMGRDKALLPLPDGRLLWQQQLAILRALQPAQLFISGFTRDGFPPEVPILEDATPGLGPLGGIAATLAAIRATRLVVLAIDLPCMSSAFLRSLLEIGDDQTAVVPLYSDTGYYEPLAAMYPASAHALARSHLQGHDRSLQSFVHALPHVTPHEITPSETALFTNWNRMSDFSAL